MNATDWRTIDTAPTGDGTILIGWGQYREMDGEQPAFMRWYDVVDGWCVNAMPFYPTHWMPIPPAPVVGLVPGFPDYGYTKDFEIVRVTAKRGSNRGMVMQPYVAPGGYTCWNLRKSTGKPGSVRRAVLVCTHYHGPRPKGCLALHRDGNPANDTRDNLYWGTHSENMADMVRHGRAGRTKGRKYANNARDYAGEKHPRARLTEQQAREIKAAPGLYRDIGAKFGVSGHQVGNIKRGDSWGHL